MAGIAPLAAEELPEFAETIDAIRSDHGYVPNSFLTLARHPAFLTATGCCADAFWYSDTISNSVRGLAGFAFSWFSGAMYSAAHLGCWAEDSGLPRPKLLCVQEFEMSGEFDERERALLRLCRNAARMPSEVTDQNVADVRRHFDDDAVVVLFGLIAWHAFLNRWNDMIGTQLEEPPRKYAEAVLGPAGWNGSRHT